MPSGERTTCDVSPDTGFWAPGPHLVIEHALVYDPEHAQLERQIVETNPFLSSEVLDEPELYLGFVAVKR